ncbi:MULTISPECIES: hypothetical protein [unclassified Acidovorax]|uniref:hypothetical protein n=1 Tax=unclassified Acidovorax TaxID=2684926 RepID=UPI00288324C0|nr:MULTISPECIES: hypothetical protein [unclassified Acidovorax]
MNTQSLLAALNPTDLTLEATPLVIWEMGAASTEEEVARFMYRGGPLPPQASAGPPRIGDHRPEKKYWDFVKSEMQLFLCADEKKYRALWKQILEMQKNSTTAIVGVIATFLGASIGVSATLLSGFIAVCLFAALKVGKEAYCAFTSQNEA